MKKGITSTLAFELEIEVTDVAEVIFTFKEKIDSEEYLLQKSYPEDVTFEDNKFLCKLTQEETDALTNTFFVEAQVNLTNKSVIKSDIGKEIMPPTLWTTFVEDNESSGEEEIISLTFTDYVEGGGSGGTTNYNELSNKPKYNGIEWVGNKTDTDMGIATKQELSGKQNTVSEGNGIDITNDVVSIDLNDDIYNLAKFNRNTHALEVEAHDVGFNETVRESLTNDSFNYQLASKVYADALAQALGNTLSVSIDSQTYVMTLQLKHNNQVLSTGTVDLPLETMVVDADYDSTTKEIVLTLQSGSTVRFSVADLVSGLVDTQTFNEGMATKVDKGEITDTVTLVNDTWSSQIDVNDFAQVYWGTGVLPSGATLWLRPFISHTPSGDAINVTVNTAYDIDEYDQIAFKITGVSEDFDFTYTLQNDVVRQKEFKEQLADKQDTIDSTHKLSADNVDDTSTTNKFTNATEKQTWNGKQDTLTAGSNISISNNEISATDTTYSAGTGLSLSSGAFSVDNPVPSGTSSDYGKYLKNNNGTLEWASVSGSGGLTPTNTAPTTSTSGSIGDQLLLTTRPSRIYTLVAIENNDYIWVVTSGENVVFEEIPPTPTPPGVDAELEVKRIVAVNSSATRGAYTPYFDYTAIDNVGETTAYYKIVATCSEGYYVRSNTSSSQAVAGTYPADGSVSTPNAERTEASNKAPYNNNKYIYIGVGINPYRTITEDEIDTILENANVQIKVYNDQDQEVASYKMVNKVVD